MRRIPIVLAAAALASLGTPPVLATPAPDLPGGVWAARATAGGAWLLLDSHATGGAVTVADLTAPFAEATIRNGPGSEAIASYAFDRNAATGVYAVASATSQQNEGPAFPAIPNVAYSRYPGGGAEDAGVEDELDAEAFRVGGGRAHAETQAGAAVTDVRSAWLSAEGAFTIGAQEASSTTAVAGAGLAADATVRILTIKIGEVLEIDEIRGTARAASAPGSHDAHGSLEIVGARVAGTPVDIGAHGVRVAEAPDGTTPAAIATLNEALREQLAATGIDVTLLATSSHDRGSAGASSGGLRITMPLPTIEGVPGGTIALVLGRVTAGTTISAPPPPPDPPRPIVIPPRPPIVTTTTITDDRGTAPTAADPPARAGRLVHHLPPVVGLFALWQTWTLGWVGLAWSRRGDGVG